MDVDGRRWTWMGVDGQWMDADGGAVIIKLSVRKKKKYLLDAWGQPACGCPMTLEVVVVVVVVMAMVDRGCANGCVACGWIETKKTKLVVICT